MRATIRGLEGFDVQTFLPRLLAEELPHLEASFVVDELGVVVTAMALAPTAEAASAYVEGRLTASLRKRELPWSATVIEVSQAQT